ncbi:MAG: hypothetical protein V1728_03605 [Candidatus Micrarchaeota archaeon]
MELESAAILHNPKKPSARALVRKIEAFLEARGVGVRRPGRAQIIITISGDGTILYNKNRYAKPFFAIGSKTSKLCQTSIGRWRKDLGALARNGFSIERRLMLSAEVDGERLPDALNEVVVRNRQHRLMHIQIQAARKTYRFRADGVIFSTATGSGAYAYSCGGKKMPPRSERYQIVAIAPHLREFGPTVLDGDARCVMREDAGYHERMGKDAQGIPSKPDVVVDGQFQRPLRKGHVLRIWRSGREMEFVKARRKA